MPVSDEFLAFVQDLLAAVPVPEVAARRMFGGVGLYSQGLFFAILADDTLYLKADDWSRECYRQDGVEAFSYTMRGQPRSMDYWSVPAEVLEESEALGRWVALALAAAVRARGKRRRSGEVIPRTDS